MRIADDEKLARCDLCPQSQKAEVLPLFKNKDFKL